MSSLKVKLLVSREYENFLLCIGGDGQSYMPLPHPSGITFDGQTVHVASTRNPNELFALRPLGPAFLRSDRATEDRAGMLSPYATRFFPGSLYLHDLAMIDGRLHGNAVGHNSVVAFGEEDVVRVWWPASIDTPDGPRFDANFIQLNSIAAGATLEDSFFSASSESIGRRRPGHLDYPVKGRGVIFSGHTRGVFARGLTRPHSARLSAGRLFVDNSGYGELCEVVGGEVSVVARLSGWTRGLSIVKGIAFVGTSRVLPKFERYAPGVNSNVARCGIDAVDLKTGTVLASIRWRAGNQIFAIDAVPDDFTSGLPFGRKGIRPEAVFYACRFDTRS